MICVLFPILFFYAVLNRKVKSILYRNILFCITCFFSIFLSIQNPISISDGRLMDLRWVPLYLSYIYGGPFVGLSCALFFVFIRLGIGGDGMYPAFLLILLSILFVIKIRKNYTNWKLGRKLFISCTYIFIATSSLPLISSIIYWENSYTNPYIHIYFSIANVLTLLLTIYIIETILENELLHKELIYAEKIAVLSQLAASVAHEVRNPLTSVQGFLQLLASSSNKNDKDLEYISISLNELKRANDIISDYLSLSKRGTSNSHTTTDIYDDIHYVLSTVSTYATLHNVQIFNHVDKSLMLHANSSDMKQLLINLIRNSIEALDTTPNGIVEISLQEYETKLLLKVLDNGKGMTNEQIERLGLPFYSTKEKGTGLGLMVCYRIVESLGGEIKVASQLDKGTTFTISLPK
ncbi:sensor histidine kinase [Bacillus mesophilus]|nr:sensor histidine kinase [Bacillus mesophilus]